MSHGLIERMQLLSISCIDVICTLFLYHPDPLLQFTHLCICCCSPACRFRLVMVMHVIPHPTKNIYLLPQHSPCPQRRPDFIRGQDQPVIPADQDQPWNHLTFSHCQTTKAILIQGKCRSLSSIGMSWSLIWEHKLIRINEIEKTTGARTSRVCERMLISNFLSRTKLMASGTDNFIEFYALIILLAFTWC